MEVVPMTYMFLPLTDQESKNAKHWGLKFALDNESRWVNVDSSNYELQTYDRGLTYVVLNDVAYAIARDFVLIEKKVRLLIGRDLHLNTDLLEAETGNEVPAVEEESVPETTEETETK